MEAIAGVIPYGSRTSGEILIDNKERNGDAWEGESAYGRQAGYTIEELTVDEFVYYSTVFSLPNESKENIKKAMDEVLSRLLGLEHVRSNRMGNLSGGERKRVVIATTFMKMLLFEGKLKVALLDEPTSELDSGLAMDVAKFLKNYARRSGTMILVTIHQPGHGLFNTFDGLLFMDKGVKIYAGPTSGFMEYLNSKGIDNTSKEETDLEFIFGVFNEKSERGKLYKEKVEQIKEERRRKMKDEEKFKDSVDTAINFIPNFSTVISLAKRQLIIDWRNWNIPHGFISTIALALTSVIATKFGIPQSYAIEKSFQTYLIFKLFSVFLSSIPNGLLNGVGYTTKEVSRGLYDTATLWFSALVMEIPLTILRFAIFFGIIYYFGLVEEEGALFLGSRFMMSVLANNIFRLVVLSITDPFSTFGRIIEVFVSFIPVITLVIPIISSLISAKPKLSGSSGTLASTFLKKFFESLYAMLVPNAAIDRDIYNYCSKKLAKSEEGAPLNFFIKDLIIDSKCDYSSLKSCSGFILAAMLLVSLLALSLLGISFLDRRLTPSMRYQLSNGKTVPDESLRSKIRSFTRGIWFKRLLITFFMVLIILTVTFALYKKGLHSTQNTLLMEKDN